ncbi:MAG TPA: response regulator [Mycobacteriales bacterium]|nr:response regulator [Mycobacteriales bacterium]
MTRVLVVDDEPPLRRTLAIGLRARGYDVDTAADGRDALATAHATPPDLVLLDLGLPDLDGVEVIRRLRDHSDVPIVVLSARAGSPDKVGALDAGADDYVTKPFGVDELLARLRAVLRRSPDADAAAPVRFGDVVVDLVARTVVRDGAAVHLTPTEWGVLDVLLRNPGRLVPQRQVLHAVWGPGYDTETNYLRLYLAQLRRKLEPVPARPRYLITEPGMGYRFQPD